MYRFSYLDKGVPRDSGEFDTFSGMIDYIRSTSALPVTSVQRRTWYGWSVIR